MVPTLREVPAHIHAIVERALVDRGAVKTTVTGDTVEVVRVEVDGEVMAQVIGLRGVAADPVYRIAHPLRLPSR